MNFIIILQVTLIHLEDRPRLGVVDVIRELQDQGKLRVMMLTGDHKSSAWRVANAVGINEVHCSLKPEDKLSHVKEISRDMGKLSSQHIIIFATQFKLQWILHIYLTSTRVHFRFW